MIRFLRPRTFWKVTMASVLLTALLVMGILLGFSSHGQPGAAEAQEPSASSTPIEAGEVTVNTIHPKYDPSFALSVKAPAQVQPYEAVDLEAQVAGQVEYIRKAEGSRTTAGELLVQIAVPELDEAVQQKESIIRQRQAELEYAKANQQIAQAAIAVASRAVEVAESEIQTAQATEDFRGKEYRRFSNLVAEQAATQQIVDERAKAYQAAVADTARARAAVLKAKADREEAQAKFNAAKADVLLKTELITVAQKDRDRAQALANYARITAPFDGVITRRNVNRGSFVQNATTGHAQPLLRVERRDIVTVTMKVPDTFAPYVNNDTEAVIAMSELPGQALHGKVTRYPPTLESEARDHTLLVEVDLFNGTDAEYAKFLAREKAKQVAFDDLKEGPLPLVPHVTGANADQFRRLYPGMYGEMQLIFRHLRNIYLVPSDAIVRQGGQPYILLVKNGKAAQVPVEVQLDDQHLAKVALITKTNTGVTKRDLTDQDEVIYSNQSELTDGEPVKAIPRDWKPQD